ncbi:hypothetical protein EAG_12395 [Camponotus floridanus]|uniref:Uncharacterized protein n=1 Tax=Camponotus floridanus TaxID=104421 RepID=E2AWD2_CAMFO|nr:hypothetical protein EAG_12395 [Camponotus floridanus]
MGLARTEAFDEICQDGCGRTDGRSDGALISGPDKVAVPYEARPEARRESARRACKSRESLVIHKLWFQCSLEQHDEVTLSGKISLFSEEKATPFNFIESSIDPTRKRTSTATCRSQGTLRIAFGRSAQLSSEDPRRSRRASCSSRVSLRKIKCCTLSISEHPTVHHRNGQNKWQYIATLGGISSSGSHRKRRNEKTERTSARRRKKERRAGSRTSGPGCNMLSHAVVACTATAFNGGSTSAKMPIHPWSSTNPFRKIHNSPGYSSKSESAIRKSSSMDIDVRVSAQHRRLTGIYGAQMVRLLK